MTEFRKLSERIAKNIYRRWHCCNVLPEKESKFFEKWFQPTHKERFEYDHLNIAWMAGEETSNSEDNNLRILALLFAEQLWLDLKEGEKGK